ncbi:MAG TPA: serine/threonine protein phosphatase [Elusimicrobia bacterium]|nr:serine/threonine protein phosphatase [Elusimicrobiota bacterium]
MIKDKGLAFKLTLILSASALLVFLLVFGSFYHFTRKALWRDIETSSRFLAESTVHKIDGVLRPVQEVPEAMAEFLEEGASGREATLRILRSLVDNNRAIYGSAIAFEPYSVDKGALYHAPYYYKKDGRLKFRMLGGKNYRYFEMDWYRVPKETDKPFWTEPYLDEGGGDILMATYAVPFYRLEGGKHVFAGVATADVSLDWLSQTISSIKVLETGDAFLISRKGTFVAHRLKRLVMKETLFKTAEARGDWVLKGIGERMVHGEKGFVPYIRMTTGMPSHMYFAPILSTGWSLAVVFPDAELMADMGRLSWTIVLLGAFGLLVLVLAVASECRSITGPLSAMTEATESLAEGNLDVELPPARSKDEVGRLTEAFRRMTESLKEHIRKLTETTAAKQRIESELNIAREIQMSTLPKIFPPLPDIQELEMYAMIEPAREVGGDLYDFYLTAPERFCFVIGDVSGKGVPASLFMAVSKTLLKSMADHFRSPAEVLRHVNDDLSDGNEKAMFVTVFFAAVDTKTGEVEYSNGGHNPPLLMRKGAAPEFLAGGEGMAVGALKGAGFSKAALKFAPGDRLFLYTDGVTEAMDPSGALYGEERMLEVLRAGAGKTPKAMILDLLESVHAFSKGEHSDDITMMALDYLGPDGRKA